MKFKACSSEWVVVVLGAMALAACLGNDGLNSDGTGGSAAGDGRGGSGASGVCGQVCPQDCELDGRLDGEGCPTCTCKPAPQECSPDDCANQEAPAIAMLCPDGSAVGFSCRLDSRGRCSLQQDKCPTACNPVACDLACPSGFKKGVSGCDICSCAEPPACANADCGPVPPVAPCPGGTGPSMSCERSVTSGKCTWNIGQCNECTAPECGILCEFGNKTNANGCPLCQCNPAPTCTTQECGVAPKVATRICEDGSTAGPECTRSKGKCGWQMTSCPASCSDIRDLKSCELDQACRWLEPGCSGNKLSVAGCFARTAVDCESDRDCVPGKQCATRTVDHCAKRPELRCLTCASPINVCL